MPNVSQPETLEKIAALISDVADTGIVLTRERFIESDKELLKLFANLNSSVAKGWLVNYVGFTQIRGDRQCEIIRTLKYKLLALYPYRDKMDGGSTSHEKFRLMIEAVNESFNAAANWNLSLGNAVQHNLLQVEEDFSVEPFGEGADTQLLHIAILNLEVELSNTY